MQVANFFASYTKAVLGYKIQINKNNAVSNKNIDMPVLNQKNNVIERKQWFFFLNWGCSICFIIKKYFWVFIGVVYILEREKLMECVLATPKQKHWVIGWVFTRVWSRGSPKPSVTDSLSPLGWGRQNTFLGVSESNFYLVSPLCIPSSMVTMSDTSTN